LSTPSGNPDVELALSLEEDSGLPGFARLKVRAGNAGSWAEFIGPDGRLRRDLVKVRIAALLAAALKKGNAHYKLAFVLFMSLFAFSKVLFTIPFKENSVEKF
jgi:hypothetical protein